MSELEELELRGASKLELFTFVLRPRAHLTRYHGIFASNFIHRDHILPQTANTAYRRPPQGDVLARTARPGRKRAMMIESARTAPRYPGADTRAASPNRIAPITQIPLHEA